MRIIKNGLKNFSNTIYSNKPTIYKELIGKEEFVYDAIIHDYHRMIKAYLEKRRVEKEEICKVKRA
jgi:hypothetical protein